MLAERLRLIDWVLHPEHCFGLPNKTDRPFRAIFVAMDQGKTTALERAFELAKSGDCGTVDDIRKRLKAEGYRSETVTGPTLLKQLRTLITAARSG